MAARYPYGEFYASLKRGDIVVVNGKLPAYLNHARGEAFVVSSKRYGEVYLKQKLDDRYVAWLLRPEWLDRQPSNLEDML